MTILMTFAAPPVLGGGVENEPGGTTIKVWPGENFTLRFKLFWNEPGYLGFFVLGFYWDSPRTDSAGTPSENFTFVRASAYLEDNLDPISTNVIFSEGISTENPANWRYAIVVEHQAGCPHDDNFYVDVVMRASGAGGVPHVPTNNHPIFITGTIDVMESTFKSYTPPDPMIRVRVLGRNVDVSISPRENSGPAGTTLNYSVMVTNTGTFADNYALTISDDAGWGPTLDNYTFKDVENGENRTTTLSVIVPENAVTSTEDNIKVTATSLTYSNVSDNETCKAHAEGARREVKVTISPPYQSAPAGTKLSYTVTVRNTGNVPENYALTASDDAGWVPSLSENRFDNVAPDRDRTATLDVTIPGGAVPCTEDNIRVTAISMTDNAVDNSAGCTAHAILREVGITISPGLQRGGPDENIWGEYDLKYTVTVTNRSAQPDNYTLTVHDTLGWDLRLVGSILLGVPAGENRSATLYVEVPGPKVAKPGTEDLIIVTATSQTDRRVSNYASCVAQAGVLAFEVSVSPSQQSGTYFYNIFGEEDFAYTVTVTNKGTLPDNYTLTVDDNLGWRLRLEKNLLSEVPAGENDNTILFVEVPEVAEPGTEDKITVVMTSQTNNTLTGTTSCIARAALVDMEVTISPSYQRGSPGETLVYLLTIKNTGDGDKPTAYSLPPSSNSAGWGPTIDDNELTIRSGENKKTKLSVRVPDRAVHGIRDNLTVHVSAPSQVHMGMYMVEKEVSSMAQAETLRLFISPGVYSERPGENLTFVVLVKNVGIKNDNYTLEVSDDAGWGLELSENSFLYVLPSEWRLTTLSVAIPENATGGCEDNVKVTVIPGAGPAASESENCVAIVAPPGVRVSVSPESQGESAGAKLGYAIIVRNFDTKNDSYDLTFSDTQGWVDNIAFSENLLVVPGLERRSVILEVAIPSEAARGTVNKITVTATSRENKAVRFSASCEARVEPTVVKGDEMTSKAFIVRGDATAQNVDAVKTVEEGDDPPDVWYSRDDYPPLIVARRVENGAVVAAGLVSTCRDGRWKPKDPPPTAKFDVLLDVALRWMKPDNTAPIKVLWYGEYGIGVTLDNENYYVENGIYNDIRQTSQLINALKAKGYTMENTIDNEITLITSSLLENYDILVIPEFQIGGIWSNGGDTSLLPDADVETIKSFVEGGGGLLIMEGTDYFGYNFYKVQNKILTGLGIDDVYFQSDQVNQDSVYAFNAEVMDVDFGVNYRKATGLTQVWVYSACSLVVKPEKKDLNVSMEFVSPSYLEGLPGETLTYTLTITNTGKLDDAYILDAIDNAGFVSSVSPSEIILSAGTSDNATLIVTIPEGTPRGMESRVTVVVTSVEDQTLGGVAYCKAWTGALGVSASIDPTSRSGRPGENLKFYVYVTNTGDFEDNYTLAVSDTAGWEPVLSLDNLTIAKGRTKFSVLNVIIPEGAASGAEDSMIVTVTSQTDNTVSTENSAKARVAIVQGVDVSISPTDNSGAPGRRLNFDVTVRNTGTGADTFRLTASDTRGWGPTLSITSIQLPGGASRTGIQLSVEVPDDAAEGDSTTITVTASGTGYQDSASCTARAIIREVEISISPESQTGPPGENVTFTVVVANTSEADDSYDLTVSDNAGWGAVLSERLLTVPIGENRTTKLSVIVPSEAAEGESTMITVAATSRDDPAVSDTATCTAEAREKAPFPIVPIGVGGAAIGGAIAAAVLLKSRPPKQSLLAPRPFRSNPARARKYSEKWL